MTGPLQYAQATREFRDAAGAAQRQAGQLEPDGRAASRADDIAAGTEPPSPATELARWHEAAALRRQRGGRWVIIWSAQKNEFQARPTFSLRAIVAMSPTIDGLAAEIDRVELRYAARRRQGRAAAGVGAARP